MNRFLKDIVLFLVFFLLVFYIRPLYLLYTEDYKNNKEVKSVYFSIFKSRQKNKLKKILLGDSVGLQLFPNDIDNRHVNSLASNQAISLAGQFFLLNNYINAGNRIDTLFMFFVPASFLNNLNQTFTYNYFLKPFYVAEYKPFFTKCLNKQISKIPYNKFCREPYILTSNWAPDYSFNDRITYTFLSPISVEYLTKIKELSIKHSFKIIIRSPPLNEKIKLKVEKINRAEVVDNNLTDMFDQYFDSMIYIDNSMFIDGTHLNRPQQYKPYFEKLFE